MKILICILPALVVAVSAIGSRTDLAETCYPAGKKNTHFQFRIKYLLVEKEECVRIEPYLWYILPFYYTIISYRSERVNECLCTSSLENFLHAKFQVHWCYG